jgi:hypothetical protein
MSQHNGINHIKIVSPSSGSSFTLTMWPFSSPQSVTSQKTWIFHRYPCEKISFGGIISVHHSALPSASCTGGTRVPVAGCHLHRPPKTSTMWSFSTETNSALCNKIHARSCKVIAINKMCTFYFLALAPSPPPPRFCSKKMEIRTRHEIILVWQM